MIRKASISKSEIEIKILCDLNDLSKSGYYKWLKSDKDRDIDDYLLIKEVFDKSKSKKGFRRIYMDLKNNKNIIINHKKIIRLMNKYGLVTKVRRINPYKAIMKKTAEHRTFENILNRNFKVSIPFNKFSIDITYVYFNGRKAYLCVIKDISTREAISWYVSTNLSMHIVLKTIENMKKNINIKEFTNILIHSDQGFHFTNPEYIQKVKELKMIQSMSRKGNCIDNCPIESFFGHFKDEVDYKESKTFGELNDKINKYMNYYNNERYQWNLKKMTPVQYRNHLLSKT